MLWGLRERPYVHLVAVGAAGILGADGDLPLGAVQTFAHAAHVHGDGLGDTGGNAGAAAMAHFLIDRDVGVELPLRLHACVFQVLGKAQQNAHRQLVVQEAALEVAGGGAAGAGVEAHNVANGNAQGLGLLGRGDILVQDDFNGIIGALGVGIAAVDVDGGVHQLAGALVNFAAAGIDLYVLRLGIVGAHAAQGGQLQPAVALDLADHGTQGVGVGLQQQGIVPILAAQLCQNAALGGDSGRAAQGLKGILHPLGCVGGKAGGRIHSQQRGSLLPGKVRVRFINHDSFLLTEYSARLRPPPA